MSEIDFDWVRSQFDKANVRLGVGGYVLQLLSKWDELQIPEKDAKEVIEILSKMATSQPLVESREGVWTDAVPGQIVVGAVVRVRNDAFTGETGRLHNGRTGRVVAVRYGDIIVRSTDDGPLIDGAHYSPHVLEVQIVQ
jgi:hypothetical protein